MFATFPNINLLLCVNRGFTKSLFHLSTPIQSTSPACFLVMLQLHVQNYLCSSAGMNAAVVLLALLLAVPVQLLVSHYLNQSYEGSSGEGRGDAPEDVTRVRAEAVNQ